MLLKFSLSLHLKHNNVQYDGYFPPRNSIELFWLRSLFQQDNWALTLCVSIYRSVGCCCGVVVLCCGKLLDSACFPPGSGYGQKTVTGLSAGLRHDKERCVRTCTC